VADNSRQNTADPDVITSMESPKRVGLLIFFLVFGVFGVWAAVAPIDGAANAPGTVIVRSNRQVVQHLEGGIVQQILVRNGDVVDAGEPLLVLNETQQLAQLQMANAQFVAQTALEARLIAERDGLDEVQFPVALSSLESNALVEMASQEQIFRTRKNQLEGSIDVLQQRIEQLQSRLQGLRAQRESKEDLAESFAQELNDVRALLEEGFSDKNRLRELERNAAILRGEAADITASISSTEMQIGETRLEIIQAERRFQNEVATQLSEVQTEVRDITERRNALRDIVSRTVITAPVAGVVNGLQVHTEGGVIGPGSRIADIVPQSDELIVEARVSPTDIDRVAVGQEAAIRFSSFSSSVPNIFGVVTNVSADAFTNENTGASYYTARLEVTPEGRANLGDLALVPGMPAEVFIVTGSRTFLQYLMKPFTNAIARSFRED
jgi:membrane fusion protein, type I secretion system